LQELASWPRRVSPSAFDQTKTAVLAMDFRRQAQVCARLAEDCQDRRLADRFKKMATDLLAKADDFEELPSERARQLDKNRLSLS
jgi:hypothetical protein